MSGLKVSTPGEGWGKMRLRRCVEWIVMKLDRPTISASYFRRDNTESAGA